MHARASGSQRPSPRRQQQRVTAQDQGANPQRPLLQPGPEQGPGSDRRHQDVRARFGRRSEGGHPATAQPRQQRQQHHRVAAASDHTADAVAGGAGPPILLHPRADAVVIIDLRQMHPTQQSLFDHVDGGETIACREHAVVGRGRASALGVAQVHRAGFVASPLLDLLGQCLANAAESCVSEGV